jgi:hypothetical protein
MTQDEIIKMAIKAELNLYVHDLTEKQYIKVIGTFAKLVAAKEREQLLYLCELPQYSHQFVHTFKNVIRARGEA